jgi:uncharacterized protein (UPF0276 family)
MRPLGVGLVYWADLDPLARAGVVDVIEVEPQTLWSKSLAQPPGAYRLNEALFETICMLPQPKLLHGVGHPVAATVDDPIDPAPLLRRMADRLDAAWVSEHLSFNRVQRGARCVEAGFLLPPLQTVAGARVAAAGVQRFGAALGRPAAFETGVNYFQPRPGELDDGAFFRAVAEEADSGIVLDLHNLWCNERNGRQPMREALAQLPLERVWELHFAGGMALDGYWLDAHSGRVPAAVLELAAELMPQLPHVGALLYEILPEHLDTLGLAGVERELDRLRALWALRRTTPAAVRVQPAPAATPSAADLAAARRWEGDAIDAIGWPQCGPLAADRGAAILRRLVRDMRSANVTRALKCTMTALVLACGVETVRRLVDRYVADTPPDAYAAAEAHQFAEYLAQQRAALPAVPYLDEVLAFEHALLQATLHGRTCTVKWSGDPTAVLGALESGQLPQRLPAMACEMTVAA